MFLLTRMNAILLHHPDITGDEFYKKLLSEMTHLSEITFSSEMSPSSTTRDGTIGLLFVQQPFFQLLCKHESRILAIICETRRYLPIYYSRFTPLKWGDPTMKGLHSYPALAEAEIRKMQTAQNSLGQSIDEFLIQEAIELIDEIVAFFVKRTEIQSTGPIHDEMCAQFFNCPLSKFGDSVNFYDLSTIVTLWINEEICKGDSYKFGAVRVSGY